jgi:hypothetical protein
VGGVAIATFADVFGAPRKGVVDVLLADDVVSSVVIFFASMLVTGPVSPSGGRTKVDPWRSSREAQASRDDILATLPASTRRADASISHSVRCRAG